MKNKNILLGLLVAVLVVGGVFVGMNWNNWFGMPHTDNISNENNLNVDENAGDYVAPEGGEGQTGTGIAIPGWESIAIPAGQTDITTVNLENPEANEGSFYLSFEMRLKDTGEVLFTTELVPPGKTIQHVTLSRALDAGEYDAVIRVQPYTMDEAQTPTNNADMATKLIVQ